MLLSYAYSVEEQAAMLSWTLGNTDLNWNRSDFDVFDLRFRDLARVESPRLTRYWHPRQAHRKVYFLVDGNQSAKVSVNWARYYMLHRYQQNVLLYDDRLSVALLPSSLPLPRLIARGLVACSGFLPQELMMEDGNIFKAFVQVPQSHADLISAKLGQKLTPTRLLEPLRGLYD
jgi:hypothetical protein